MTVENDRMRWKKYEKIFKYRPYHRPITLRYAFFGLVFVVKDNVLFISE